VPGILVLTGYGREAMAALDREASQGSPETDLPRAAPPSGVRPVHIAADLPAAVHWILRSPRQ
jgi:hypothetical protein